MWPLIFFHSFHFLDCMIDIINTAGIIIHDILLAFRVLDVKLNLSHKCSSVNYFPLKCREVQVKCINQNTLVRYKYLKMYFHY